MPGRYNSREASQLQTLQNPLSRRLFTKQLINASTDNAFNAVVQSFISCYSNPRLDEIINALKANTALESETEFVNIDQRAREIFQRYNQTKEFLATKDKGSQITRDCI